nr:MAG TPA_asm: hypothetical protein [Caudoviricetes sp.]
MSPQGLDYLFRISAAVRFDRATNSGLHSYIHRY